MSGRRDPFDEMERFFERLSRRFDEMGERFDRDDLPADAPISLPGSTGTGGGTAVDVVDDQDDNAYVVVVDLPGYDREDVDLTLQDDRLRLEASRERDETTTDESGRYVRRERGRESISRSVRLPGPVVAEEVSASLRNGVLRVTLPKAGADDGGHRIEVE